MRVRVGARVGRTVAVGGIAVRIADAVCVGNVIVGNKVGVELGNGIGEFAQPVKQIAITRINHRFMQTL